MNAPPPRTLFYVHSSDEMYGADLVLLQLVDGLDRQAFRPVVALPTDVAYGGLLSKALAERGIKTYHLKTAILRRKYFTPWGILVYLGRLISSTLTLRRMMKAERADLVHTNTAAILPGALAAKSLGVPHIWHVHEIIVHPRLLWRLTSWLIPRLSARVVAVSNAVKDHLCAGDRLNSSRTTVIYNAIDFRPFRLPEGARDETRRSWGLSPEQPLIGMVGRISHWKGQEHFLHAAQQVAAHHAEARFAIVGGVFPGQEFRLSQLRDLARSFGIGEKVIFSDFRRDIPAVLAAFDVDVMPSTLPEPFGLTVLESMAAAKAVVANAHGGSLELVVDGVTGLLVDPSFPEAMAAAINHLIESPEERNRMGAAGKARAESCFTLDRFLNQWSDLYSQLTGPSRQALK